jgi:hypothetical protein
MMVSTSKIQLAGYGPEQVPVLRTLVGKKVTAEGEIIPAHTRYHIEPLLISIGDEEEGDIWELNTGLEDKY